VGNGRPRSGRLRRRSPALYHQFDYLGGWQCPCRDDRAGTLPHLAHPISLGGSYRDWKGSHEVEIPGAKWNWGEGEGTWDVISAKESRRHR
jgi:hypothetical protein